MESSQGAPASQRYASTASIPAIETTSSRVSPAPPARNSAPVRIRCEGDRAATRLPLHLWENSGAHYLHRRRVRSPGVRCVMTIQPSNSPPPCYGLHLSAARIAAANHRCGFAFRREPSRREESLERPVSSCKLLRSGPAALSCISVANEYAFENTEINGSRNRGQLAISRSARCNNLGDVVVTVHSNSHKGTACALLRRGQGRSRQSPPCGRFSGILHWQRTPESPTDLHLTANGTA